MVGKLKGLPLINIVDTVRSKCMSRFHKRYKKACTWEEKVTPNTRKVLDKVIQMSRFLRLILGRNNGYEIHEGPYRFVVSLEKRSCTCG